MFSGLCLAGIVAIVRAGARSDTAGLLAATALAYALATSYAPGGADPLLLLFEATAVIAIVFIDDVHVQWILVAIGVAGAALTKVEGCAFAAAVVVALLMVRRKPLLLMAAVLPAALLLAAWLAVIAHAGMLDAYEGSGPLHLRYVWRVVPETLRMASYQAGWIPWIAPLIVIALGDLRRAVLPLTMAALTFGATIFFYLHGEEDPTSFWIRSSAPRVLLTPLLMLLIAAAAALREGSKVRRLPPSSPAPDLPLPRPE